jgi:hypothetical protein
MATLGISEFTFGYAFLFEQTTFNWPSVTAAPVLPSLREENDVGWDAKLPLTGTDFYYQFKLADYLKRRNARYIRDGTYTSGYFRFALHKRDGNRQHQRLKEHAVLNPDTYYVAPEVTDAKDFNEAFLSRRLSESSRLIPLAECEEILDEEQHYITFQPNDTSWQLHSKSKKKTNSLLGRELQKLYRDSAPKWRKMDEKFARALFDRTRAQVVARVAKDEKRPLLPSRDMLDDGVANLPRQVVLLRTSRLLSAFLGVTLVLVGERS